MVERLDELERFKAYIKELEAKIIELTKVVDNLVSKIRDIESELLSWEERKDRKEKTAKLVEVKEVERKNIDSDDDIIIID